MRYLPVAACLVALSFVAPVQAADVPLYQPAPAWVVPAEMPDMAKGGAGTPAVLVFDSQQRIEGGRLWSYVDGATRVASPEVLAQLGTLALAWTPDKGDLIIHEVQIIRGGERIDMLAGGKTFTVLRREEKLEERALTGVLTATMAIEGLRVGDVLRLRYSTTSKDDALAGHVQNVAGLPAAPFRIGTARLRVQWADGTPLSWKLLAKGEAPAVLHKNGFSELTLNLPLPKQPEMPDDAPSRFRHNPLIELSTFADWADVSKTMAPLYATEGLITPGTPLAAELAAIKAEPTPLARVQHALRLTQDHVRYLAVGMNGGNYLPQKPEQTWALRYGDCKAKTLLLLALLRGAGIEAEAVLASSTMGDLVSERLPSVAAFDHVLVRAVVDGEVLWLDGTGAGSRIDDIHDTPGLGKVLPVRVAGAEPIAIPLHESARPLFELAVEADESASVDVPSVFDVTASLRGPTGTMLALAGEQLDEKQRHEMVTQFFSRFVGDAQYSSVAIDTDAAAGITILRGHGATTAAWRWDQKRMKRWASRGLDDIGFAPDRARAAWATIPVQTPMPETVRYRLSIRLPDGGRGYTFDGQPDAVAQVGGYAMSRKASIADGRAVIEEQLASAGAEIPADRIPDERDKLAVERARAPRLVAPPSAVRRWSLAGHDPAGATQIAAAEKVFTQAIARDPEEMSGYYSRASFRRGIGDLKGALADFDKVIELAPDVNSYLARARVRRDLGDIPGALADASAARNLDPSSVEAINSLASLRAESGDLAGATTLLDQRIELGGETKDTYRTVKASLIGTYGKAEDAISQFDSLIAEKPRDAELLNARCWVKGTRLVMMESALADCTSAIELSGNSLAMLDSRALVYYRLGRFDDAMKDLDTVIDAAPDLTASHYLRGVVLTRLQRGAEAKLDLGIARRMSPRIDIDYARFGIKP